MLKSDENFITQLNRKFEEVKHRLNLKKIKKRENEHIERSLPAISRRNKMKINKFDEIYHNNILLRDKLLDISHRDFILQSPITVRESCYHSRAKKQKKKIDNENQNLAKKILNNSPSISYKQLMKEYESTRKLCQSISRQGLRSRIKKFVNKIDIPL